MISFQSLSSLNRAIENVQLKKPLREAWERIKRKNLHEKQQAKLKTALLKLRGASRVAQTLSSRDKPPVGRVESSFYAWKELAEEENYGDLDNLK